jgi:hypothetical protein
MTKTAVKPQAKAKGARSGLSPGFSPVSRGAAPAGQRQAPASLAPAPSRRARITPLTPMRVQTAKSMSRLASSVRESHPDLPAAQHLMDAARTLRAGQHEASQRHLRAAMFSLTPQSLMRNGQHTDDLHIGARSVMHDVHRHLLLVKDLDDVAAKNQAAIARDSYGDDAPAMRQPNPNAGYGPGANAQKPTARQPGGDRALNAPNRADGGGPDLNVAEPQLKMSKQFSRTWDEVGRVIELVGPKGYIHGWIFVGIPAPGDKVDIPGHGRGTVTGGNATHARVSLASGHIAEIKHDGDASKPGKLTKSASAEPVQKKDEKDWQFANRKQAVASIAKGGETLFHGTRHEFKPGDIIDAQHSRPGVTMLHEGKQYAFASTDPSEATFAGQASRPGSHVYRVEPVDKYEFDPHQGTATSRRTTGGFRVVEEVAQETGKKLTPKLPDSIARKLSMNQLMAYNKTGHLPPKAQQALDAMNLAYGWNDIGALIEMSAETGRLASTPAPRGKPGGPGLYRVKSNQHSPYMQQIVKALIEKRGMDPGKAYAIAWGAMRKWSKGGGKVHPEVRAAAAGGLGLEKAAEARAHAHASTWDEVAAVVELAAVVRVPAGQAGGGQFGAGGGTAAPAAKTTAKGKPATAGGKPLTAQQQAAQQQQKAKASATAKATAAATMAKDRQAKKVQGALTQAAKPPAPDPHQQHVAHMQELQKQAALKMQEKSAAKEAVGDKGDGGAQTRQGLLATASADRKKASALIAQRKVLQGELASAGGATSSGQSGSTTSAGASTTASTAPAVAATPAAATPAATTPSTTAASSSTSSTPTAAQLTTAIAGLTSQITSLLKSAAAAQAQAAKMGSAPTAKAPAK